MSVAAPTERDDRRPLVGTVLTLPGATAAELLSDPFDFVWIDLEHGALGPAEAQEMIIGAQATGAHALVRLPADAHALMALMLDAGADGVVLADVADAEVASAAVRAIRLPPLGTRGFGPRRLAVRYRNSATPAPLPAVWTQIETAAAVDRAAEIAAVDGVAAVVVGTADLSFSLGVPLDTGGPELAAAVAAVRDRVASVGKAFGVAGALDAGTTRLADGADVVVLGTDARLCAAAVDAAADQMRQLDGHTLTEKNKEKA